jgi:hypothetical protein
LYRDPAVYRPARAEVHLDIDLLVIAMPDGRTRRHSLHGITACTTDGFVVQPIPLPIRSSRRHDKPPAEPPHLRRFVRMLWLDDSNVLITPPDQGAVAPNVVRVPEAPAEATVVDMRAWEALAEWLLGGARLAAWSIADLARLACIAAPQFAVLIGEIAAQRALELAWVAGGPLRGGSDLESALQPLVDAARSSPRASEALISALAHAAGAKRRRRRAP